MSEKLEKLYGLLSEMGKIVVSFSGGTDSAFLLKAASKCLKNNVIAVTAVSPSMTQADKQNAIQLAEEFGVNHHLIETQECEDPDYIKNDKNRCYYCKKHIGLQLLAFAEENGYKYVVEGSNADDSDDYRPGLKAKNELGLRSPLQEIGFSKQEIRVLSKKLGIPTWNKPSSPCLASRIPYDTPIDISDFRRIEYAEQVVKDLGIEVLRVRHHGETARIEVEENYFPLILKNRKEIVNKFKEIGYLYIALDLAGFKSGNLNEGIENG